MPCVAEIMDDAATLTKIEDSSQDFIVARHVLEHLMNPVRALKTWFKRLKPNGILALAVPNHDLTETMVVDYTHVHAFDLESLIELVESVGFRVEDTRESLSLVLKARKP